MENKRLKNKVAIITGGATGIGGATALHFAQEGAKVAIADVNEVNSKEAVIEIQNMGSEAIFVKTDVSSESEVIQFVSEVERSFGRLDILVNAAGILKGEYDKIEEFEAETWDEVIDINLKGTFLFVKHSVPLLKKSGGGVIICIASGAGIRGASSSLAYGSSKAGIQGFAITLAQQLEPHNIRVNVVCPGNIATPLKLRVIARAAELAGKSPQEAQEEVEKAKLSLGKAEGIANVLAFLASDEASYVTGTIFTR